MPQLIAKPLSFFKPDPNQPRKHFDADGLRHLGESLKVRQNEPIQALADGTILDGERRWRSAKLVGLEKLDAIITDVKLTQTEINVIRLTSFFHKADLNAYEKWLACAELMCGNPTWQMKDLADALKLDPSSATRYLSPSKCTPAWQEALKAGKVGISDCYAASKLPESEQSSLLTLKLSGATRDQLEQVGRKARATTPSTSAVRLSRVRCPLSTGTTVVVSGPEMSLECLIDALSSALDAARRAHKESLDIKTAEKVWKDKAKANQER
jgi:ParB family transcriptional regulator, chromosome partitioning protein